MSRPGGTTGEVLAGFWTEVLDIDGVVPTATLLELGGDSLSATMIANRIELAWGFRPDLEQVLTLPFGELRTFCEQKRPGVES